jgi:methyl-accepting chemotaxis protein
MKNRRSKFLIEPRFQLAFILRMAGWVTLATAITGLVAAIFIATAEQRLAGDIFYVIPETGSHPVWLSLWKLMLPALAIALPINLLLTLIFSLMYSARLAGPIFRLEQDMLKIARGDKVSLNFTLRDSDEMQDVAHAFDALLKSLSDKGYLKNK